MGCNLTTFLEMRFLTIQSLLFINTGFIFPALTFQFLHFLAFAPFLTFQLALPEQLIPSVHELLNIGRLDFLVSLNSVYWYPITVVKQIVGKIGYLHQPCNVVSLGQVIIPFATEPVLTLLFFQGFRHIRAFRKEFFQQLVVPL